MESHLADVKQMFNIKDIAYATTLENLAEGQFGIYAEGSDTSIAATVDTFAELPDRFNIVSKLGGKVYYSFSTIEKSRIRNIYQQDYVAPVQNEWEVLMSHCACIEGFVINIHVESMDLIQQDGLTWVHRDFVVGVAADEIDCQCADGVLKGRDNNVLTKLAYDKIVAMDSPYYTATVRADLTGVSTYADATARDAAIASPVAGNLAIVTGTGLTQYNGSAWVTIGDVNGNIAAADIDTYITNANTLNTDSDADNDTYLKLVIVGKNQAAPDYNDLEVNYVYPRGVKLMPSIDLNDGEKNIAFTETVAVVFEKQAGYDMRAMEWDTMNYSTNLNYYTRLSDGIAAPGLKYQFENGVNYDVLSFEYETDKVDTNSGRTRLFGVYLASATGSQESADIEDIFTA